MFLCLASIHALNDSCYPCSISRKLYWADAGGVGVPPKIGKASMDGSNPQVLVRDTQHPLSLAIDIQTKVIYWSTENPPAVSGRILETLPKLAFYVFLIVSTVKNEPL